MKPIVSDSVQYFSRGVLSAAIVTKVNPNGTVNLCVFGGEPHAIRGSAIMNFNNISMGGPEGETPTENCWNWPQD